MDMAFFVLEHFLDDVARILQQSKTIRKIEHGESNPQFDVLYAIVTTLQIDPSEIFYPGSNQHSQARKMLEILFSECSDNQIAALLPIIRASLDVIISNQIG